MSERDTVDALAGLLMRLGIDWVLIGALPANLYHMTTRTPHVVDLHLLNAASSWRDSGR